MVWLQLRLYIKNNHLSQYYEFILQQMGLHYRHTDNVVQFFGACENAGLPSVSKTQSLPYI
mgnify:CR=1 FL=1